MARRDNSTSRAPCVSNGVLASTNPVLWQVPSHVSSSVTIATAAVMSRGLAVKANTTFKTTVQEPRDRTGLPAVASALSGCRWISHDSQWNSGQSRRGVLVRLTIVFSRLWNLVHAAKVILVVPLPKNGGRVVQKSYWNDLVLSSTEDDLLRELDRPSALWISVPEEPGPTTFLLFWSSGSSLARCASSLVSMQKCVPAINPTCADSALGV